MNCTHAYYHQYIKLYAGCKLIFYKRGTPLPSTKSKFLPGNSVRTAYNEISLYPYGYQIPFGLCYVYNS